MAEVLEATMLLCFGASWPISVIKNIKAKTAKSMSVQFILLIITGYLAGICAKIISHRINYVLIVYVINLIFVSINLGVYFMNRKKDLALEQENQMTKWAETEMSFAATDKYVLEKTKYEEMNRLAEKDGVVFFGSTYLSHLPVCELSQLFHLKEAVYNRSVAHMEIDEISNMLDSCVLDLNPHKVFVNLGDADVENPELDVDEFIKKYEWLLYTIHTKTNSELYVISVLSDTLAARRINARLEALAEECGSTFIDGTSALETEKPELQLFNQLKMYMRSHPLSFAEAMDTVTM